MIFIICIFLYSVTGSTVGDIYYNHYSNTQIVGEPFDYQLTLERAKHRCNSIHTCRAITKSINTDLYERLTQTRLALTRLVLWI